METKISQKDKMLLIILGIVVVVFAAVMIPTYGIKDLYLGITESQTEIDKQKAANDTLLTTLASAGIPSATAGNVASARSYLKGEILSLQYEMAKAGLTTVRSDTSVDVPGDLFTIAYLGGVAGNPELMRDMSVETPAPFYQAEMYVGDALYPVMQYSCDLKITWSDTNTYDLNTESGSEDAQLAMLVAINQILAGRGSVRMDGYRFGAPGVVTVTLKIYAPNNTEISRYGAMIGECKHCGAPYYLEEFINGTITCDECEGELDGAPIR